MLGFSAFAEQAFGATVAHQGVVVIVSGSGVTLSQGTPTYSIGATIAVTGSAVTISSGAVTFTISGSVSPTGCSDACNIQCNRCLLGSVSLVWHAAIWDLQANSMRFGLVHGGVLRFVRFESAEPSFEQPFQ